MSICSHAWGKMSDTVNFIKLVNMTLSKTSAEPVRTAAYSSDIVTPELGYRFEILQLDYRSVLALHTEYTRSLRKREKLPQ